MIKLSSKMRLFAIISSALIVIGLALGTVFHFTSDKFFNYGGEYSSYKSVTVSYVYTEFSKTEDVEKICEDAFGGAGLKSISVASGKAGAGVEITYKFSSSADDKALSAATEAINAKIAEATSMFNDIPQSRASFHTEEAIRGGEKTLSRAAIALAVVFVVSVVYTLIRYKLSAMCVAAVAQLHCFALLAAVLALCRIPVTSSVLVFAVFAALATAVCVSFTLERICRNRKDGDNAKLSLAEIADLSAAQTFKANLVFCVFLALAAVLVFILSFVSSLSLTVILSPALCALAAFAVSFYGGVLFAPALYAAFGNAFAKSKEKPLNNKSK